MQIAPEDIGQRRSREQTQAVMLAYWEAGVMGLQWLVPLMAQGHVTQVRSGGYPDRYSAQAGHLLPLLLQDDWTPPEVRGEVARYHEHLDACPETATLTIEVWDQS